MDFNTYQKAAFRTAKQDQDYLDQLNNAALGLAGESGEFCDLLKKVTYQDKPADVNHFKKELGDILWYIALATTALETDLSDIAETNIAKLKARYPDGFDANRANHRKADDI